MTVKATEARPDWRQVNIFLLASKLYAAHAASNFHNVELSLDRNPQHIVEAWMRAAEEAVDELIDKPDREFQAQLEAVLAGSRPVESTAAREWREASVNDWLPEHG